MVREELIRRLAELAPPTPAACFALLWQYFRAVGVTDAENLLRKQGIHPTQLEPLKAYPAPSPRLPERLAATRAELQRLKGPAFDVYGLQWLMSLDRMLKDSSGRSFDRFEMTADDGTTLRVRRRNAFIAEHYERLGQRVTGEAEQSRSLATYTRYHAVVPDRVEDVRIEIRAESRWGYPFLHDRLREESPRLKVMLWPLQTTIDYASLDVLSKKPPPEFVSLRDVRNEPALREEVRMALETARQRKVTLLIFPELAIPPETEAEIRCVLESSRHGRDGYPLLTLFGCCHVADSEGKADFNEASLLGPDGRELCRHRKLASFTSYTREGSIHAAERLEVGKILCVLESPLGNITPLICLDLFNSPLQRVLTQSHGNLLAVPSLSPKTTAHRNAAASLQVTHRASTFVSNRWIEGEARGSFYQVPRPRGYRGRKSRGKPFLLFTLEKSS